MAKLAGTDTNTPTENDVTQDERMDVMYSVAVRSAMLYGAETWPMTKEDVKLLERTEMRMLRWMAGVSRSERRTNQTIRTAFGVQPISLVVR